MKPYNGRKRVRTNRVLLKNPAPPLADSNGAGARRRGQGLRLAIVAGSVVACTAVVFGWGPPGRRLAGGFPFTYRLGMQPAREIRVMVHHFHKPNPGLTNTAREKAARAVPPLFNNDPDPIHELHQKLIRLAETLHNPAKDAAIADVLPAWGLSPEQALVLRRAVQGPGGLYRFRAALRSIFAEYLSHGILGPDSLPKDQALDPKFIVVRHRDLHDERLAIDRVRLARLIDPKGDLARAFRDRLEPPAAADLVFRLVAGRLKTINATLVFDSGTTEQRRQKAWRDVEAKYDLMTRGEVLVPQGEPIDEDHLELLRREHDEYVKGLWEHDPKQFLLRGLATLALVGLLWVFIGMFIVRYEPLVVQRLGRLITLCAVVVGSLVLARFVSPDPWRAEVIPIALAAMMLTIAYNQQFGMRLAFALSILTTIMLGGTLGSFIVLMGGTVAAVLSLTRIRSRTKLITVGGWAGLTFFVLTWITGYLAGGLAPKTLLAESLRYGAWGLVAGFFIGGALPFVENLFGLVTEISLLELGDINHPLLQELVRRAPGTYNHSVMVATIAEAAAERIGCNGLLVRVGAYFHDIGKMVKPHYFIENQADKVNRHDSLAPAMSTLIIIGHVRDGIDLGRQYTLPDVIIDLIEQHHGTTLVEYFYYEAARRGEGQPDQPEVEESAFRYPGPKPQTKEAGILMLADAVESASRTLRDPTPARIENLVRDLSLKRLLDGQFDDSGLTLRELRAIEESVIKSLIGVYHGRVKYPEQRTA